MRAQRQPMLWAALAFACGLFTGQFMWRPPLWWVVAAVMFTLSAAYFLRRRIYLAIGLGWAVLFLFGALTIQVHKPASADLSALPTDGHEVIVTAHVIKEGLSRGEASGETSQRIDVETEQILDEGQKRGARVGVRLSVYGKDARTIRAFRYGERVQFPAKLEMPRNYRNPGAFDYAGYLADNGIQALASTKYDEITVLRGFSGNRAEYWRARIYRSIIEKIHTLWPQPEAGLMDAVVIGEQAFLNRPTRANFQRSGTYHVLVVSGMNVTILAFATFWFLRRIHVGEIAAIAITVALMMAYAILTDLGAPIWRATLMVAVYFGARLFYRGRSALNAIGAAALAIMIFDPKALFGASFQLTFLCVWLVAAIGIPMLSRTTQPYVRGLRSLDVKRYDAYLAPRVAQLRLDLRMIAGRLARFAGKKMSLPAMGWAFRFALRACELIAVSAILQIGLALPMAYYFHRAAVMSLPANLFVIPLLELLMPAAIAALMLGYLWMGLAKIPALVAGYALDGILGTVHRIGESRLADVRVPTPAVAMIVVAAVAIALAMVCVRRYGWLAFASIGAVAASAFWISASPQHAKVHEGALEVTAIDVGQGDSLLVVTPQGRSLLVDAGGLPGWVHSELDMGEDVVSPYLWSRGFSQLDYVALTHAHADHMGGMAAVLENFHPRELWLGVNPHTSEMQPLLDEAQRLNIPIKLYGTGEEFGLGGAQVRVLAPSVNIQERDPGLKNSRRNEESLVMKISYGNTSALLEGDAERATENELVKENPQADLLKVGHHGSNTSTTPEFLAAVHPRLAVISVGQRNVYGHPRPQVLERLAEAKAGTYRTDMDGAVSFYLDGRDVTAKVVDIPY